MLAEGDARRLEEFGQSVAGLYRKKVAEAPAGAVADFGGLQPFNLVSVGEDLAKGERVKQYAVEALTTNGWTRVAGGTTVGQRQLHRIAPVTASAVRLTVERSEGDPVATVSIFEAP